MPENPDFNDLLLEWEEQNLGPGDLRLFCESRGIDDEATVREFAKKANSLDRITRFLDDGESAQTDSVSALKEQQFETFNQVEVQAVFATGGRSAVHLAYEKLISRPVALKTLLDRVPDPSLSRARLIREARVLGSLQHPGILPVYQLYDSGTSDVFYTMPLVEGETLQQHVSRIYKNGSVSLDKDIVPLLKRFTQVCQAAAYAHSRGISHRDIKPENILLGDFGRTYLVDWGIAKRTSLDLEQEVEEERDKDARLAESNSIPDDSMENDREVQLTNAGSSMGTPAYMSPEQAAGMTDYDSIKSDIFNLGATLYFLLTGRPPYQERTMPATLETAADCSFKSPRDLIPATPGPLESICLKAMSREPGSRYDSAQDIQKEIDCWLGDLPIPSHRESPVEKIARWNRKNGKWMAATLAMAASIVLTAVIAVVLVSSQKQQSDANTRLAWQTVNETVRTIEQDESLKFENMRPLRQRLLETSLENYNRLLANPANQSALQHEFGNAFLQSGKVRIQLVRYDEARRDFRSALKIFSTKTRKYSSQQSAEKAAECLLALSGFKENANEVEVDQLHSRIESWCQQFPESVKLQQWHLEALLLRIDRMTERRDFQRLATQVEEQLANATLDHETKLKLRVRLKQMQVDWEDQLAEKVSLLNEVINDCFSLVGIWNSNMDTQLSHTIPYAEALRQRSEIAENPTDRRRWLEDEKSLLKLSSTKFPTVVEFRKRYQDVLLLLSEFYAKQNRFELALRTCQTASDLNIGNPEPNREVTVRLANALLDVGNWHRANGRVQESQFNLLRTVQILEESNDFVPEGTKQMLGQNLLVIGVDQWIYGDSKAARESFVRSESLFTELLEGNPSSLLLQNLHATSQMAIALSDAMLENTDTAIPLVRSAIDAFKKIDESRPEDSPIDTRMALHTSHFMLAALQERKGLKDEAEATRLQMEIYTPQSADAALQLARTYAWESQIYGRGKNELSESDLFFIKQYHRQTLDLIETALSRGFQDVASLENDPNFMPLFRYERFRHLFSEKKEIDRP